MGAEHLPGSDRVWSCPQSVSTETIFFLFVFSLPMLYATRSIYISVVTPPQTLTAHHYACSPFRHGNKPPTLSRQWTFDVSCSSPICVKNMWTTEPKCDRWRRKLLKCQVIFPLRMRRQCQSNKAACLSTKIHSCCHKTGFSNEFKPQVNQNSSFFPVRWIIHPQILIRWIASRTTSLLM